MFYTSSYAQTPQSNESPSSDRITFDQSIKEIVPPAPLNAPAVLGTLVRTQLVPAEAQATLDFSVALEMHNFAELQERTSKGEIISLDEIAAKYYPTAAEYKEVVDWLTAQGLAVKPSKKLNLSVFASGSLRALNTLPR